MTSLPLPSQSQYNVQHQNQAERQEHISSHPNAMSASKMGDSLVAQGKADTWLGPVDQNNRPPLINYSSLNASNVAVQMGTQAPASLQTMFHRMDSSLFAADPQQQTGNVPTIP